MFGAAPWTGQRPRSPQRLGPMALRPIVSLALDVERDVRGHVTCHDNDLIASHTSSSQKLCLNDGQQERGRGRKEISVLLVNCIRSLSPRPASREARGKEVHSLHPDAEE